MDLNTDFNFTKIDLATDSDAQLHATLISSKLNKTERKSVLYLHGYIDYFFHPHVAEEFHKNDFDFYALDLRRYGRSLLRHQKPNYCRNIEEYFEEITASLKIITRKNGKIYILGHSTGGLIASCYMNKGELKEAIAGLLLNSPFLELAHPKFYTQLLYGVLKPLSKIFPNGSSRGVGLSQIYAESLHKDYKGKWEFNLDWKPINGYPIYFCWFVAIVESQRSLKKSHINVPVLLLHSRNSLKAKEHIKEVNTSDTVLNIDDMKRIGPTLGYDVSIAEIKDGMHDLFLSSEFARKKAFEEMFFWLKAH
jgi:alpha-beta hydrolase superfamily lysophospholipase